MVAGAAAAINRRKGTRSAAETRRPRKTRMYADGRGTTDANARDRREGSRKGTATPSACATTRGRGLEKGNCPSAGLSPGDAVGGILNYEFHQAAEIRRECAHVDEAPVAEDFLVIELDDRAVAAPDP